MVPLGELNTPADYIQRLPRLERDQVIWRWISDYWDYPISGMVTFQGESCWCQMFDESDPETEDPQYYRRFVLIRLSSDHAAEEEQWHQLFRKKVGTHWDIHEDGSRDLGATKPREIWDEFYIPFRQRPTPDWSMDECIGWFEV